MGAIAPVDFGQKPVGEIGHAIDVVRQCGQFDELVRGQVVQRKRVAVLAPCVYFTQHDVRCVQLAKSAIRTAVEMLLQQAGLQACAIERFIIAGAFGAYIDIASGVEIGLFPDLPLARFEQVGNAAGAGVRKMLASCSARERAAELAAACHYVELSTRSEFQKTFLHQIGFPSDTTRKPT